MHNLIVLAMLMAIAVAGIYPGGPSYIQVTHTMDDRVGQCSEGSVTFYGAVKYNGELMVGTSVKLSVTEATWNGTDYENIPSAETEVFYTTTGWDGYYRINKTLEECCNYGFFNIEAEAWELGLSGTGLLHIAAPPGGS